MTILDVWLEGLPAPIGVLASDADGAAQFAYHEAYVATADAFPISLSLPLREEAFDDVATRGFFQNLLQENDQLSQVMQRERIERGDIVGLLYHLGADCAGALSCLPTGRPPTKAPGLFSRDYDILPPEETQEIVRRLANNEPLPDPDRDPSPLAGVQKKIAVACMPGSLLALPKPGSGAPTTHILKVPLYNEQSDAVHEALAARLAQACGLETAIPHALDFGGYNALLVPRFDRTVTVEGLITRIHQEDFAQALGLAPLLKYERKAGRAGPRFDAAAAASVLARTAQPAIATDAFLRATLFNLAIGNTDNHAKNHALLYDRGPSPRLAPLYDLLPIRLNPNYTDAFAFRLGSAETMDALTADDLAAFFAALGVKAGPGARLATEILSRLDTATAQGLPKAFDDLIGQQSERLIDLMGLDLKVRERDHFQPAGGGWGAS